MVFKKGMGIAEKVLKVGFTESASEVVTELANILYDLEVLNDDLPPDEFFKRLRDAAVIGFMMGGGMSAPFAIAEGVTNKLDAVGISAQKKHLLLLLVSNTPGFGAEPQAKGPAT